MLDYSEFSRWMDMAKRTLESARRDAEGGDYNWACFKAQQAAEFAVKAYLYGIGQPRAGHAVSLLLSHIGAPEELVDKAKYLDKMYVPTRYPNAWSEGAPYQYYTRRDAEEAIEICREVIDYIEARWKALRSSGGE